MSAQMTPFAFNDVLVRTHVDENGDPWFVAKDVCKVLEIQNPSDTVRKILDEDERGVATIYTLGGEQKLITISESGLYSLIFRSRKPDAKKFRKWVTSEVLPTLRKNGTYSVPPMEEEIPLAQNPEEETVTDRIRFLATEFPTVRDKTVRTACAIADKMGFTDSDAVYSLSLCLCKLFNTGEKLTSFDEESILSQDTLLFLWKQIAPYTEAQPEKDMLHAFFMLATMVKSMQEKEIRMQVLEHNAQKALEELARYKGMKVENVNIHMNQ